ncbi:MAG: phage/plasmid primase, P4 family [Lachnospiraceae bacterium]|nr:phage/plasmid primase, P4 family [Lachnospiraceae bacterium]
MIEITKEIRQQLLSNGVSDEDIDNMIAEVAPQQAYSFNYHNNKIQIKDLDLSEFATYIIKKYRIVKIENSLHYYERGLYKHLSDDEFDKIMIDELHNSRINIRREIRQYVKQLAEDKKPSMPRYILFNNGVYDLQERKILPFDTSFVFCNRIPHNYNVDATGGKVFEDFILSLADGNKEVATLIKEIIGYSFYRKNPLQEFHFFFGPGGNGKSTLFGLMIYVIGEENVSFLTTDDMKDTFNLPHLKNKLINIGDDVEGEYMENVSILKKIVSGEAFLAGGKFKDKEPMIFRGAVVFSGNKIPKMSDKTNGIKRRMNIVPLLKNFKDGNERDINITDKLCTREVAEYCIKVCVEHLQEVLKRKSFTKPQTVIEANLAYEMENNHVKEFIEENESIILEKEAATIYKIFYLNFCKDCGYRSLGRNEFYSRMQLCGYKKVQRQDWVGRPYGFVKNLEN